MLTVCTPLHGKLVLYTFLNRNLILYSDWFNQEPERVHLWILLLLLHTCMCVHWNSVIYAVCDMTVAE